MARIYAGEDFPRQVAHNLRSFEPDVVTVRPAGNARIFDRGCISAFAIVENRAVLIVNRRDFFQRHKLKPKRCGIPPCTQNNGIARQTANMNDAISTAETLRGKLIRVDRTVTAIYILSRSAHRNAKQCQSENYCIGLIVC
ncbi:DUF5615 family PIN-like protein [Microcoleus sp. S36b_A3]|uniref:DUF5615 family PIN-like protein n=1 Tax=unclassified Microcoleus TaxID=2642155 RepID=UPI002FCEFE26